MISMKKNSLDDLSRVGSLLTGESDFKKQIRILAEQSISASHSDLCCVYLLPPSGRGGARLDYQRGNFKVAEEIGSGDELLEFILESGESVILLERKPSPFLSLLLHEKMQSGMAVPLFSPRIKIGILILNSGRPFFYNRTLFTFLDSLGKMAGYSLDNAKEEKWKK